MTKIGESLDKFAGAAEQAMVLTNKAYDDTLAPAAKQVGRTLETVGMLINVVLSPIRDMVFKGDLIQQAIERDLRERLLYVPEEKIITPPTYIAVPTIEALRYTLGIPELRELFMNLLATSMNSDTVNDAHPAFVEIIKQMNPIDAKLMQRFSIRQTFPIGTISLENKAGEGITLLHPYYVSDSIDSDPEKLSVSIVNLERLGLVQIDQMAALVNKDLYNELRNHAYFLNAKAPKGYLASVNNGEEQSVVFKEGIGGLTTMGITFTTACITETIFQVAP